MVHQAALRLVSWGLLTPQVLRDLATQFPARQADIDALTPSRAKPHHPVQQVSRQPIDSVTDLAALGLGSANKPNGRIYRLRATPDGPVLGALVGGMTYSKVP